jgi:type II secretory pathway pseudopilin PulG
MKLTPIQTINRKAGMTLIELTVVILVLLALIAVLFVGARAYKDGADKAACIMNLRNIQQAARSWVNLNPNTDFTSAVIIGEGLFIDEAPICPAGTAAYTIADCAKTAIPAVGTLFAVCPQAHVPAEYDNW